MRGLTLVRAASNLAGAYPGPLAMNIPTGYAEEVYFYVGYTMGAGEAANAVVFYVEWSTDHGTTWFRDSDWHDDTDAVTNGAVTIDKKEFTYTADAAATVYDYIVVSLKNKGNAVRINFRESGVAANAGTCLAYIGFDK